jgi:hypothetical protein
LPEVTLYRRQIPGDFAQVTMPNATDVVINFWRSSWPSSTRSGGYRVVGATNVDAGAGKRRGEEPVRSAPHRSGRDPRDTQTSNFVAAVRRSSSSSAAAADADR